MGQDGTSLPTVTHGLFAAGVSCDKAVRAGVAGVGGV